MKKGLKITLIVVGVLVGIIALDTLQAKIFDNSPILKIRDNLDGVTLDYIDKGIFVNHYHCNNNEDVTTWKSTKYSCPIEESKDITNDGLEEKFLQCLEGQLGGYLVTEKDELVEIPLSEIKKNDTDKIEYYKGVYASEHPDNMYLIVYPKNGTYDTSVMKDFDKYFYEKFSTYQTYSSSTSPTIYIHNSNLDVDFKNVLSKCQKSNSSNGGKSISSKTVNKLNATKKIVIKTSDNELGTIKDNTKIEKILSAISSSKQYGDAFLCDNYAFNFEMYDSNNKLVDTIYVWFDGKRLIPSSINSKGCSYYSISNGIDLRQTIEEETDYLFYNILDFRDNINETTESLIYKDNKNSYYLKSKNSNEILIEFILNNKVMTLKYALENKYISAEKVANDYKDILIKK